MIGDATFLRGAPCLQSGPGERRGEQIGPRKHRIALREMRHRPSLDGTFTRQRLHGAAARPLLAAASQPKGPERGGLLSSPYARPGSTLATAGSLGSALRPAGPATR